MQINAKYEKELKQGEIKRQILKKEMRELKGCVIKPLYSELEVKDEIIKRYKTQFELNLRDLKVLNTVIKVPSLTQEF